MLIEADHMETVADSRSRFRRLLTTQGFVALVVSNALGFGGEQMRLAVQAWWILGEGGSNTAVGLAAGLRVIPVVLISLYAGVVIDRFGGKRVLLVERWLLVALALATALVLLSDGAEVWHIVTLSTIAGATIAIGFPATQTLVPEIVPADLRPSANLLNQIGPSAGRTFGSLLAGILIAVRNAATALFGLTAVYVVAVAVTMRLPASRAVAAPGSTLQQIADGYRYIRRTPVLFWTLFLQTFSAIFFGLWFPLVPAIAVEVLDTSEVEFGWMWGAVAIGQASTAILLSALGGFRRNGAAMVVAALIFSVCVVAFGLTHSYWLALVFLFGMGVALPLWVAAGITLVQNFTAQEYRGRVMAVYGIGLQSISAAWLLGGWLLDVIGIFPTVLVAVGGGWILLMTAMVASKELRSL
jgi:MFS family permease